MSYKMSWGNVSQQISEMVCGVTVNDSRHGYNSCLYLIKCWLICHPCVKCHPGQMEKNIPQSCPLFTTACGSDCSAGAWLKIFCPVTESSLGPLETVFTLKLCDNWFVQGPLSSSVQPHSCLSIAPLSALLLISLFLHLLSMFVLKSLVCKSLLCI